MTGRSKFRALSVLPILAAATVMSESVDAQTADASGTQRYAHVFVSNGAKLKRLGGARSMLHFGFGMEWRHPRGLGVGIEAGPRFEDHKFTHLDDLMLSVDVSYHGRSRSNPSRVVSFLAALAAG